MRRSHAGNKQRGDPDRAAGDPLPGRGRRSQEDRSRSSSSTFPPARGSPAAHSHDGYEETIYGLEGVLTWTIEGTPTEVGPGEALCIPRGAVHQFANSGEIDAKALAIVTPGILGPDYFREVAAVLDAAAGGPPDLAAVAAVMRSHGLTPAP